MMTLISHMMMRSTSNMVFKTWLVSPVPPYHNEHELGSREAKYKVTSDSNKIRFPYFVSFSSPPLFPPSSSPSFLPFLLSFHPYGRTCFEVGAASDVVYLLFFLLFFLSSIFSLTLHRRRSPRRPRRRRSDRRC